MSELPGGTVTFLFTDIEGSTQLLRELGGQYGEVLAEHERILRSAFEAHGGRVVDTQGDSFFAAFPRARDAVAAAADAQRRLAEHAWPDSARLSVRMGLHTGEPTLGAERYIGMGVHKAARIGAAAHGGQVLLSRTTSDLVEDELPAGVAIRDLGERRLKDVERPERLSQPVIQGMPSKFGPLRTLDVEARQERRRTYARAALLAVLAAAAAVAVFALGVGSGGEGAGVAPNSVAVVDAASNEVVGSVPVGIRPRSVVFGAGSVWVANTGDDSVSRIDAATSTPMRTIAVGEYPSDVAFAAGSVWVALGGPTQIRRVDVERNEADEAFLAVELVQGNRPDTGPVVFSSCSREFASLTGTGQTLWFACNNGTEFPLADVSRIAALERVSVRADEALTTSSAVALRLSDIAFGLRSAWITNRAANAISQIDAGTLRNIREVTVGRSPEAVAVGFGAVWVANFDEDTVSRFEVEGLQQPVVVDRTPVADGPVDVAVGESGVWVVSQGAGTLSRLDPETGGVVATVRLGQRPMRVATGGGRIWVTVQESEADSDA